MSALVGALKSEAILSPYIELAKTVSASQNIDLTAVGTITYISWDSQVNVDTGFTHSTTTNNTRITFTETGRYEIKCVVPVTNGGTNRLGLKLFTRVDGSTVSNKGGVMSYSRGNAYNTTVTPSVVTERDITASSYIEIGCIVSNRDQTTTSPTVYADCQLIIRRIR